MVSIDFNWDGDEIYASTCKGWSKWKKGSSFYHFYSMKWQNSQQIFWCHTTDLPSFYFSFIFFFFPRGFDDFSCVWFICCFWKILRHFASPMDSVDKLGQSSNCFWYEVLWSKNEMQEGPSWYKSCTFLFSTQNLKADFICLKQNSFWKLPQAGSASPITKDILK